MKTHKKLDFPDLQTNVVGDTTDNYQLTGLFFSHVIQQARN